MKKRLLSILAAIALVLALSIPFAVPVAAAAPVLTSITPQILAGVPSFITSNGINTTYTGVTFNGTFANPPLSVSVSGANVTVGSFSSITTSSFVATITVGAAAHGPRDVTVTTADGVSNLLYRGILVGEFPFPVLGTGSNATISLTPFYDAGGTFTITSPSATPITTPVLNGTTIWYQITMAQSDPTKFNYEGGQLSIRFPHNPATNAYIPVAGYGNTTPGEADFPEIKPGSPLVIFAPVAYTVSTADLDPSGFLVAEADYGSTGDNPTQDNGIVEGQAPTILNASITNSLLMVGSLRVNKSVVIPNGVQLAGLNGTFTVTVTGPGGYNNPLTFTLTNGVISPGFIDIFGLTPGTYHVAETPGSPWVASIPTSGNVTVTSDGTDNTTVTNTYVPGSLTVSKVVNLNGVSGTGITMDFTVTVSGPNSFSQILTFHVVNGVVTNSPQTLNNLVPGAYTVVETSPGTGWTFSVTNSGNVTVTSDGGATSTVTNNYVVPHTTVQSMTANPTFVGVGGGNVTITVVDTNDGNLPISNPSFVLSGNPAFGSPINMTAVSSSDSDLVTMNQNATWTFTATVFIAGPTTFTAAGDGIANGVHVAGPSETRTLVVGTPVVPASSPLSIGLLILAFAGGITVFGWQRRRNSHKS